MDYCLFEPVHGREPDWDCSQRECEKCGYWYQDPIIRIFAAWKKEAGVTTPVLYKFDRKKKKIIIYSTRPGLLIGYHGRLYDKYLKLLQEDSLGKTYAAKGIEFVECDDGVF